MLWFESPSGRCVQNFAIKFHSVVFFVYFYHMLELFQQCGIFSLFLWYVGTVPTVWYFMLYQYVVIKLRNSIKRIPLHIRINRSNPPHFTACVNPLSRLPTPYVAVFWVFCFVWAFNATAMRWICDVAFQFPNFRRKDHRTLSLSHQENKSIFKEWGGLLVLLILVILLTLTV